MCNFNKQNDDTKALIHLLMKKCADTVGGANFLLGLIEAMKEKKPNALIINTCKVDSKELKISWNKIVFKDKFDVLEEAVRSHKSSESQDFNLLENDNQKKRKKILNMVKTLAPIEFSVTAKGSQEYSGFNFKIFETVEEDYVKVNPIFAAMFFCSTEYMKKALKYEI
ncbi:MAG: hypothetical protein A2513_11400 [Sulfurimonas sp. RIFOXYD12_FULL_33_39]|uniref:hypothetical protein n=1 Tax=unclassified Sulfurimonas TaxID=2623549 RepID=UPI0008D8A946|nr:MULTISPECIES: hypothetical protein [unclassified Sulfurimonas]OHE03927.1 MAG: hypothetical protein A3G74_06735 [Sulfurimonas sp. RIFCSPLOWO2_12_FULL_34_6]OHE09902.1 MAG: hypothetical protein A2513_11400 [Sulfurimonas sp. RIFOXYD12_FULL_33_39]OHE13590.1 MAG: hypothetical protein A2530_08355 [Sulfurimonas sp. RIFOXYD2_FULL_34_21]DAB28217.1 MAG TPA: hypothetical protein CFH78_03750 [Sulfurimonas sp. UBA10385]